MKWLNRLICRIKGHVVMEVFNYKYSFCLYCFNCKKVLKVLHR